MGKCKDGSHDDVYWAEPLDWEDNAMMNKYDDIIKISIDYTAMIKDNAYSIIRFDNAHGYLHIHRFWESDPEIITKLTNEEAIIRARKEIDKNWKRYRKNLEKLLGDL